MAGTLTLALSQQNDQSGQPLSGALLYFFVTGTSGVQQNSYSDSGLTTLNPWPLVADATGRIPMFYLANGTVHIRLTDASGTVIIDQSNMQVIT